MKHKRPPIPVIVILILALLTGGYFLVSSLIKPAQEGLSASGTIETIEITISPEIGGKVIELAVEEGSQVKTGQLLFRLDDTLLQKQRAVSVAGLESARAAVITANTSLAAAQANFDLAENAAHAAAAANRTADWRSAGTSGYSLPGGYFSQSERIAAAQTELQAANSASNDAQTKLTGLLTSPGNASFVAAETRLAAAHAAVLVAKDVLTRATAVNATDLVSAAQSDYDAALSEEENAQSAYDGLKDGAGASQIIAARVDLALAQERFAAAQDHLLALQTGEESPQLTAARALLTQAQAAASQAGLAVPQAEAALALIDAQIGKLTINAPQDGTILLNSVQVGEIIAPSSVAMKMAQLDQLTITVYVPENVYGEISLGQTAKLTVDSFPGEIFNTTVIHIANQAEFTPRNVQTASGRSSTVFAIKLNVIDPAGKLKPGMPADVAFR